MLLTARYQVVDFEEAARADILSELKRWSEDRPEVAVRLIHAEAGVGKTRLGIKWTQQRRDAGWSAGFLVPHPPEDWFERLWKTNKPLAIVIDYAESRTDLGDVLLRILRYWQQAESGSLHRLRILLLARNNGDWWASLKAHDTALGNWLETTLPSQLTALAKPTSREQLFRRAVDAFAKSLKKSVPARPSPALTDPLFDRALYLYMAALAFVEGWELTPNNLIDVVLDHEERFWFARTQASNNKPPDERKSFARQLVAAATLRGGIFERSAVRAIAERFLERTPSMEEDDLIRRLQQIYQRADDSPGRDSTEQRFLPALEPDLLGEGMVLRVVNPKLDGDKVSTDWIERVFPPSEHEEAVITGFTVLGRASAAKPAP